MRPLTQIGYPCPVIGLFCLSKRLCNKFHMTGSGLLGGLHLAADDGIMDCHMLRQQVVA